MCFLCGCALFLGTSHSRQVCMSTVFLHCWQRTEQHQENLQEQRCTTSARPARKPGPQHNSSHPSGANREVPRTWNNRKGWVKSDEMTCKTRELIIELIIRNFILIILVGNLDFYHYNVVLQCQECHCLGLSGRNLVKKPSRQGPVWLVASLGGPVEGELCESPRVSAVPKQKVWLWPLNLVNYIHIFMLPSTVRQ